MQQLCNTTLVERRVRNDTSQIDGVIVSGCYFYSDTFDSYVLWPIRYIAIKQDCSFDAFDQLRAAWHALALKHMNALVQENPGKAETKDPVADMQFDVDGITYVKPTPPMGSKSDFFVNGRPRLKVTFSYAAGAKPPSNVEATTLRSLFALV